MPNACDSLLVVGDNKEQKFQANGPPTGKRLVRFLGAFAMVSCQSNVRGLPTEWISVGAAGGAGMTFGNRTLALHLIRGAMGFGALAIAVAAPMSHWASLALIPVALVALKGCPVCWAIGLVETIAPRTHEHHQVDPAAALSSPISSRRTKMQRSLAILALVAATAAPPAAWADVVNGTAAKVPTYQARGASEIASAGPLAPSLQGKPVVVRIHADWCSACKATQATIDDLKQAYAGKINFVQFDVTNAKTAAASQAEAQKLGLEKFYDASKAATSTVAVMDPQNGKIYATFYNDGSLGDYKMAVNDVLSAESK